MCIRDSFYGVQTFIQLLPTRAGVLPILPTLKIIDYPRFPYRGMHLDVVRHFFPVDFIKKYIDYLALHKLNYFHWHLTDDQAWRVEMKCRPELTEKGSIREGEIFGLYPGKYQPLSLIHIYIINFSFQLVNCKLIIYAFCYTINTKGTYRRVGTIFIIFI